MINSITLYLIIGSALTLIIGLLPALFIRYVVVKHSLQKRFALPIAFIWTLFQIMVSLGLYAYLEPSATDIRVAPIYGLVAGLFYLILSRKSVGKSGSGNDRRVDLLKSVKGIKTNSLQTTFGIWFNSIKMKLVLVIVIIITVSFGLYSAFATIRNRNLEDKVSHCRKLGEEYGKNERAESPEISYFIPIYAYNKQLNTCLYRGGYIDSGFVDSYIVDMNTNIKIVKSLRMGNKLITGVTQEEFENQENKLFGKNN